MKALVKINDLPLEVWEVERLRSAASGDTGTLTPAVCPETPALVASGTYPAANIRIPLQEGDAGKANLLLGGEISRVDPASAERITLAIVREAAQLLLDLTVDFRRRGMFLLPFRVYTMTELPDGSLSFPSPQAIALPADFPPHPEITAYNASPDALTLSLRFPVRPHRLKTSVAENFPEGHSLHTFISYPLYIPDPKEMRGSIGSVRSAAGGNATGIRFAFLSASAIKSSVAAPEKYYRLIGNERTGYRMASKAAAPPDYSVYAYTLGHVPSFPGASLTAAGADADAATDPMDWIADWKKVNTDENEEGYLPASLPYKYQSPDFSAPDNTHTASTCGRRSLPGAEPLAIRTIRVLGLPDTPWIATLYGSDDFVHWQPLRRFDPHVESHVFTPPRLFWRLAITAP